MKDDPTIKRIRQTRHEISEKCGHDAKRLVAYYQELEKQHADRLVSGKTGSEKADVST
jgi:hypothetical protein